MGKPYRAVVVYDLDFDGSARVAADFEDALDKFAQEFAKKHSTKEIQFTQVQAKFLMESRRGASGPLEEIVFRGTRGQNTSGGFGRYLDYNLSPAQRQRVQIRESQEAKKLNMPLPEFRKLLDAGKLEVTTDTILNGLLKT
jgi:hypothetical protein